MQGLLGAPGSPGSIGESGLPGATGSAGLIGLTGTTGSTGSAGAAGLNGTTGSAGPIGLTGVTGATGSAGAIGITGTSGATGSAGAAGLTGTTGSTGLVGLTGAAGATGSAGEVGLAGAGGTTGSTGLTGVIGETGSTGPMGLNGTTGSAGPTGPEGAPALSAYAEFYALMPPDNAATVGAGVPVEFPLDGPTTGIITRREGSSSTEFVLPDIGTYRVAFSVSVTEPGQLVLALDSGTGMVELPYTLYGRATGTSQISGEALVTTTVAHSALELRSPRVNTPALTITPDAGGTHPVVASIVIQQLG